MNSHAISIFIFGKRTRKAPISAATAPEAPSVGVRLPGFAQAWNCSAATPETR